MPKIKIEQDLLDTFTDILRDVTFNIKMELCIKDTNINRIFELLAYLSDSWGKIYNPMAVLYTRSLRYIYGQYVKAKKAGDVELASHCLGSYLKLKKSFMDNCFPL